MENKAPQQLRSWLDREGRKITWLAREVGASTTAVSLWLNERKVPHRKNRVKLEEVTGLPVALEEAWV